MRGSISPKANYESILAKAMTEILSFIRDIHFFRNKFQK